jgi:hypothetical protein
MRTTDDLIRDLARRPPPEPLNTMAVAGWMSAAIALGLGLFFSAFGLRADLLAAWQGLVVQAKTILPLALFVLALWSAFASVRPGMRLRLWPLALPVAAGLALALNRLAGLGSAPLLPEVLGQTALACLLSITILSALPMAVGLWLLRKGAPTRPGLSGALLGLASASAIASGYALHCTEDSPLFFVTWYGVAILVSALLGGWLGRRCLRW